MDRSMKRAVRFSAAAFLLGSGGPALAQDGDPESVVASTTAPAPPAPSWTESSEWGWLLIGSSVALGAALSATGLVEDCGGNLACRVEKSQLFWGGIGLASTGSMVGFIILENARDFEAAQDPSTSFVGLTLQGNW